MSFAAYLSTLDEGVLARLLDSRPDVRVEPVPNGFVQLAQRLGGPGSIVSALRTIDRDALSVGQAVAALGDLATVASVARLLGASEEAVRAEVSGLFGIGLAWPEGDVIRLPERLREHWADEIGGGRPVATIAHTVLLDDLRVAAAAWGVAVDGLRKPHLIKRLAEVMADSTALVGAVRRLSPAGRARLEQLRSGDGFMFGYAGRLADATEELIGAGLVLRPNRQPELPREVAFAAWLADSSLGLTGRPKIAAAGATVEAVRPTAQAAAREALRGLSALLDEAGRTPIAALKKGGVGPRERGRLAKRLAVPDDMLVLWIDIAYAAGLLGEVDGGYAPTDAYPAWRDSEPGRQWAVVASAWFQLEHAPLMREVDDEREHPPPLPLMSEAGGMRRAVLRAARDGLSVRGAGAEIDWFFPLHGYEPVARDEKIAAAVREAELLGVTAGDRLSELGEALLADLGEVIQRLLPEAECGVILQSDLTAVVSGQPGAAVSRLLAASAVNEVQGNATVWRFTPASIRAALDAGWTAAELLAELGAVADRAVPQPLEYLVNDAARRHGHVRVRATRSCVVADEALVTELVNTRGLAKLQFAQVAPTVLTSPFEMDHVLERLRAAGLSPVAEDPAGTVVVENSQEHRAESAVVAERSRLSAAEMAKRLVNDPDGERAAPAGATVDLLAGLNPRLDDAELALLAHAVDHQDDVVISYYDKNGSHSIRQIQPNRIYGRWLDSFCYLRNADREFTIANIESVAPVH